MDGSHRRQWMNILAVLTDIMELAIGAKFRFIVNKICTKIQLTLN